MLPTKQMNEQINRMLQSDVITSLKCRILFRNHFCKDPGDEMDKRLLDFCKDSSDEGKRDCFDSSDAKWVRTYDWNKVFCVEDGKKLRLNLIKGCICKYIYTHNVSPKQLPYCKCLKKADEIMLFSFFFSVLKHDWTNHPLSMHSCKFPLRLVLVKQVVLGDVEKFRSSPKY